MHPQEARLREARAYQKTPHGKARLRQRVVVEHRLARLGQLGIGQARYCSRVKTRFQLMVASALANFRWIWNQEAGQEPHGAVGRPLGLATVVRRVCFGLLWRLLSPLSALRPVVTIARRHFHFAQRVTV